VNVIIRGSPFMVKQSHGRQPREARQRRSSASADDIDMSVVLYEQELRDTGMCCVILGSETLTNGWQSLPVLVPSSHAGAKLDVFARRKSLFVRACYSRHLI